MVLSTDVKLGTFIAEVVIPAVVITGGDVSNTTAVEQPKGAVSAEVCPGLYFLQKWCQEY